MTDDTTPTADLMFGGDESLVSTYGPSLADSVNSLGDRAGWSQADRDAHTIEASHFYTDAGIRHVDAGMLHALVAEATASPPDDAQLEEWTIESRRALRERFGQVEADRRLAVAAKFIEARPTIAKLLRETGVGSHPRLVLALAEQASVVFPRLRMTPRK